MDSSKFGLIVVVLVLVMRPIVAQMTSLQPTTGPTAPTTPRTPSSPVTPGQTTIAPGTTSGPVACVWGPWGSWSKCDCTTGFRTRIRDPAVVPRNCTITGCSQDIERCNRSRCPIDCVYSKWSHWSECDGVCGQGVRQRFRHVRVPALYGGKRCKNFVQEQHCQVFDAECPSDCQVGEWGPWGQCMPAIPCHCGIGEQRFETIGFQVRERIVVGSTGDNCPDLRDTKDCYTPCCY